MDLNKTVEDNNEGMWITDTCGTLTTCNTNRVRGEGGIWLKRSPHGKIVKESYRTVYVLG